MASMTVADTSIPAWLNSEFLTEILSKEKGTDVCVVTTDVKAALPKGENYLSVMYRVAVKYNENGDGSSIKHFRIVVKTLPVGEVMQRILSQLKGIEKEMHMYKIILPSIYNIMREKIINQKLRPLSARCFPTMRTDVIVLEDLQPLGYKMANRHEGLDLDHCIVTVRALARLHAGSLALYKMDPSSMDKFEEGMYVEREGTEHAQTHIEHAMKILSSEVEKWPGYEHYAERLLSHTPTGLNKMMDAVTPKTHSINVLNHGDCWVNNMLFRYCPKTGKVDDVRFVDFQIARFSSPALDLQYFLCTSPTDDIRLEQRDRLLEEYHAELSENLRKLDLDSQQFTLQQLKEEFKEKEFFGFLTTCTILPAILASDDNIPDFNEMTEEKLTNSDSSPMKKAYTGSRFRTIFQMMLLHYDKNGII